MGIDMTKYGTKLYCGIPERPGCDATIWILEGGKEPRSLDSNPSLELMNHSPEFNWGYVGSGPAQLALALLLDATEDPATALRSYQDFKWQVIAGFPIDKTWNLTDHEIHAWLAHRSGTGLIEVPPPFSATVSIDVHGEDSPEEIE